MTLKQRIRNWLDIKDPKKEEQEDWGKELKEQTEKYRKEATIEFQRIINQMRAINCINCKKGVVQGRDAVYTNAKGQKFCSHECIDKFAKKTQKGKK